MFYHVLGDRKFLETEILTSVDLCLACLNEYYEIMRDLNVAPDTHYSSDNRVSERIFSLGIASKNIYLSMLIART